MNMNDPAVIAILVVIALAVVGFAVFMFVRQRRSQELRSRFGPEYDHTVKETGDKGRAETILEQRRKRIEQLKIRPLSREDQARYSEAWQKIQKRFVDDPKAAVTEADQMLGEVMTKRGYPMTDFNQRVEDISVHHPKVVENYRTAHAIAQRHAKGEASTEDLRQAMIHYRTLFTSLLGERELTTASAPSEQAPQEKRRGVL